MAETLLDLYKAAEEKSRLSNLSRMEQAKQIYSDIIERYQPGGAFGAGYESALRGQKTRDVGSVAQRDISRGLYGIRPYEAEWESTVGAPARLKLEDIRMERLSQSQQGLASFIERIDEPYPDYGSLMQAYQSQASSSGGVATPSRVFESFAARQARLRGTGSQLPTHAESYGGGAGVSTSYSPTPTTTQTPKDLYQWYRKGFTSPQAYEAATGKPGSGQETISKDSDEYMQYLNAIGGIQKSVFAKEKDPRLALQKFTQKSLGMNY